MKRALVVLSGGQDSATCAAWADHHFGDVTFLSFDYGQKHIKELLAAKAIAKIYNGEHHIVKIPLLSQVPSALTISDHSVFDVGPSGLPATFVPGRNLVFLTQAAAFAIGKGIYDIVTGVCQTDFSGYPDCRRITIDALEKAIYYGNENLVRDFGFRIHTPLMYKTKAETVKLMRELSNIWDKEDVAWIALANSWTCYEGGEKPCGRCPACKLRAKGFEEAGEVDPAL